jgi:hypothetical protein
VGLRLRSAAALLVATLAWLPRSAGAGPLVLELREDRRHLGGGERERVERLLAEFAAGLAGADSAGFAALFDTERGTLLLARAVDSALAYPEPLARWLVGDAQAATTGGATADSAGSGAAGAAAGAASHECLRRAFAGDAAALLPAGALTEQFAVVRVDSLLAVPLHLPPGLQPLRLAHGGRLDADPRLAPLLLLSVPTAIPWDDSRCDPWRRPPAPGGGACPVVPGALALDVDPWAGPAAREEFLDSLFATEPQLHELSWLKRRFVRKGLGSLLESLVRQQAAWLECRFQRGEAPPPAGPPPGAAGPPPTCTLGDPAVLRLLLLPDREQAGRWRLALAWLSPLVFKDFASATLEPGYGTWLCDYSAWMERSEAAR